MQFKELGKYLVSALYAMNRLTLTPAKVKQIRRRFVVNREDSVT